MHPLSSALPLPYVTHGSLVAHRHLFAPMIIMTPFLMGWDWWAVRAEPIPACWYNILFHFVSYYFLFISFHSLVVWGWSLWIDSVLMLSQPCTDDIFLIIIMSQIINHTNLNFVLIEILLTRIFMYRCSVRLVRYIIYPLLKLRE